MAEKFKEVSVSLANLPHEDHGAKNENEIKKNKTIPEASEDEEDLRTEEKVENIRDGMWWAFLKKNPNDGVNVLPPHIDESYQDFCAILKDNNVRDLPNRCVHLFRLLLPLLKRKTM